MTRGRTSTTISASDKPQIDEQLAAADVQQAVRRVEMSYIGG